MGVAGLERLRKLERALRVFLCCIDPAELELALGTSAKCEHLRCQWPRVVHGGVERTECGIGAILCEIEVAAFEPHAPDDGRARRHPPFHDLARLAEQALRLCEVPAIPGDTGSAEKRACSGAKISLLACDRKRGLV